MNDTLHCVAELCGVLGGGMGEVAGFLDGSNAEHCRERVKRNWPLSPEESFVSSKEGRMGK